MKLSDAAAWAILADLHGALPDVDPLAGETLTTLVSKATGRLANYQSERAVALVTLEVFSPGEADLAVLARKAVDHLEELGERLTDMEARLGHADNSIMELLVIAGTGVSICRCTAYKPAGVACGRCGHKEEV